jgi:hypothetical protein
MKVNVWQVGYTTEKDWIDRVNPVCREMGHVIIPDNTEDWEEEVWNLLNWSCWNYDENGIAHKPEEVHSPLRYCNSDVILQIDGSKEYKCAKSVGFEDSSSLEDAIKKFMNRKRHLWPFYDAK